MIHPDNEEPFFQIHEVHYDTDGKPVSYTEDGVSVAGESINDVKSVLSQMEKSLKEPVIYAGERFPLEYNKVEHKEDNNLLNGIKKNLYSLFVQEIDNSFCKDLEYYHIMTDQLFEQLTNNDLFVAHFGTPGHKTRNKYFYISLYGEPIELSQLNDLADWDAEKVDALLFLTEQKLKDTLKSTVIEISKGHSIDHVAIDDTVIYTILRNLNDSISQLEEK